jgi:AhpD family alkylhydroperoxidase
MATTRLLQDDELSPEARAVFDDIRARRGTDYVNNVWRALAWDPALLARTWNHVKDVMGTQGALDPLTRELIYVAVSIANGCEYCVHSHTAAARAKGMTDAQHAELISVVMLASSTNALATALQVPVDDRYLAEGGAALGAAPGAAPDAAEGAEPEAEPRGESTVVAAAARLSRT